MDVLAINHAAQSLASSSSHSPANFGVAACGTALTRQQVQLLDRATGGLAARGIVTAFDGDEAGRRASVRAYDLLTAVRAWPDMLQLPAGHDPASLSAEHSHAHLSAALQACSSTPLADLVVDERIGRHHLRWPEGQIAAARDAARAVATMPPDQVSRQIVRVIAHTGLSPRTVSDLLVDAVTAPSRQPGRASDPSGLELRAATTVSRR